LQQGRAAQATAELQRLAQEHPDRAAVHEALGRALQSQGKLSEALAAFTQAQSQRPQWIVPALQAGNLCLRLQAYDRAEEHFQKVLQRSPRALAARLGLVQVRLAQGRRDQAIELLEKILEDHPEQPEALNNLAYLYAQQGENLDQALDLAQRAVKLSPKNAGMRDTLGWICYQQGRFEEALKHLQEAIRLAPDQGLQHYHLGQTLRALQRGPEAAEAFRRALETGLSPPEKKQAEAALADLTPKD
jgi:tetratricopeptide (TPR) repeat protein